MMAMMKMMATMAAASGAAATPAPAPVPATQMDPFSMMMAMTMMMPMMMNATPAAPTESTTTKTSASSLPDLSRPPPNFSSDNDRSGNQRFEQTDRDRAFRADRSRPQEQRFTPLERSPPPFDQRLDRREREAHDEARVSNLFLHF